MRSYLHRFHLRIGYLASLLVTLRVEFTMDFKPSARPGGRDQIDHRLVAVQRFASPVDRDEREQPMLNLVLFACARRKVAHRDRDLQFVRKPL